MKKSRIVCGHEVVFQTNKLGGVYIMIDGDMFLEFDDCCGFGCSFHARFGGMVFDLLVDRLQRFYSRGGLTYMDIPDSDIPDDLKDFMDGGGSVDGFMRRYRAWKRSNCVDSPCLQA